jgi:hypothetical protein
MINSVLEKISLVEKKENARRGEGERYLNGGFLG